jgi:hypothetical protein
MTGIIIVKSSNGLEKNPIQFISSKLQFKKRKNNQPEILFSVTGTKKTV